MRSVNDTGSKQLQASQSSALEWLAQCRAKTTLEVQRIAFGESREWHWTDQQRSWAHHTGGFFTLEGLRYWLRLEPSCVREQPIINQPEYGILGFLVQRQGGLEHLLVQAKAEPGNIGSVQLAPTVQATESNYMKRHGGSAQPFLEWFLDPDPERIIYHQLQSEQGTRFLAKRNRNLMVRIPDDLDLEYGPSYRWVSLDELSCLLAHDNAVNTDARSIIASMPFGALHHAEASPKSGLSAVLRQSAQAPESAAKHSMTEHTAWLTQMRLRMAVQRASVPLTALYGWRIEPGRIIPEADQPVSVIQVRVSCSSREVACWDQPLIKTHGRGLVALLAQHQNGVLHFLLQVRMEPGHFDIVECTSTVDCVPEHLNQEQLSQAEPFYTTVTATQANILFSVRQSDEGGRFYKDDTEYRLVLLDADDRVEVPPQFHWFTLVQIDSLLRFNNLLTNQLRSLLAWVRLEAMQ